MKKIPIRLCAGCRQEKPKTAMIRVIRTPEGEVRLDRTGRGNGRGAYLCPNRECLSLAVKRNGLEHALKMKIAPEIYEKLEEEMRSIEGQGTGNDRAGHEGR